MIWKAFNQKTKRIKKTENQHQLSIPEHVFFFILKVFLFKLNYFFVLN
jgi:hypothetical protein